MAEEKKKRGRPPKQKAGIDINEQRESVRMVDDPKVSIGDLQRRMRNIFGRMASEGIPYTRYKDAIQREPLDMGMFLNNPFVQNQRIKRSNSQINLSDKRAIQEALTNPGDNEQRLRETSMALYYSNYVYQNLLRLNRDIPQYFHYSVPVGISPETLKTEKFLHQKKFVDEFLNKFNIPLTFKNVSLQAAREGKASYVFRSSQDEKKGIVDFAVLQKLPPEYIKYTGFGSESPLIVSFNFIMFLDPTYSIEQWPSWFGEIWKQLQENGIVNITKGKGKGYEINPAINVNRGMPEYMFESINGTYYLYVEMPQDLVYTFGTDFGDAFAIPDYAGLFGDLSELEAYKVLQSQTLLTNITNILTAEVPVEKDAVGGSDAAILSPEVIMGLEDDCSSSLSSNILPFFAPLENFKMHGIEHIPNATDIYLSQVRNVTSTAGASGLINTNEKPSIAMIKGEQMLHESRTEYMTLQYTKFINLIINKYLKLDYEFKVIIWGGVYTWRDEVKVLKEMIQNGNIGMFPRLLSAYRMTLEDYALQYDYVKSMNLFEFNIQLIGRSGSDSNKTPDGKVGRPSLSDVDIENENTASSIEGGQNVSENK